MALNLNEETITSPSGIGDIILTCSSDMSRNMSFGFKRFAPLCFTVLLTLFVVDRLLLNLSFRDIRTQWNVSSGVPKKPEIPTS